MSSADRSRQRPGQHSADSATVSNARRQPDRPIIKVERVDTDPLTVDQHRDAVAALAALIDRWTRPVENTTKSHTDGEATDSTDPHRLHTSRSEAARP